MPLNIDRVFEEIGELGPQQLRYCLGLCLFNTYGAWHMLQYTFVGYALPFACQATAAAPDMHDGQTMSHASQCPDQKISGCASISFAASEEEEHTIVSEWSLVCDRAWMGPLTMSLFMAGVMIGALLLGTIADHIGRRRTILLCLGSMIAVNALSSTVNDYPAYIVLKFVDGLFCGGYVLSSFVLSNEIIGASKRGLVGNAMQAFFAAGIMLYAAVASLIRHWRWLTAATSVVGLPLVLVALYLPESPRWLQTKGRTREAVAILKDMARRNGRTTALISVKDEDDEDAYCKSEATAAKSSGSICDLFRHGVLVQLTVIQVYSWFVNSATYYGLTLVSAASKVEEAGDRYTSTALSGAVEIPAYVLATFLLSYKGRRWTLCGFMICGGSSLLLVLVTPGLVLLCKLCVSASFAVVYIHSSEIFPTAIRNSAMGLVSVAARAGGIFAPFLAQLGGVATNLHLVVFALLTLSAGLLNLRLPETQGKPLPETVSDLFRNLAIRPMDSLHGSQDHKGYKKVASDDESAQSV